MPPVIVYKKRTTKERFNFSNVRKRYSDARKSCWDWGGNLASIDDRNNQSITKYLNLNGKMNNYWIGLNDLGKRGTFMWEDGKALSYINWAEGRPQT